MPFGQHSRLAPDLSRQPVVHPGQMVVRDLLVSQRHRRRRVTGDDLEFAHRGAVERQVRQAGLAQVVEVVVLDARFLAGLQPGPPSLVVLNVAAGLGVVQQQPFRADLGIVEQMPFHIGKHRRRNTHIPNTGVVL